MRSARDDRIHVQPLLPLLPVPLFSEIEEGMVTCRLSWGGLTTGGLLASCTKPNWPAWLWKTMTQGQTLSTSAR